MTDAGLAPPLLARPRTPASSGIFTPAEAARLARPWALLAESAADANVFFHPDFTLPAIACFGRGAVSMATVHAGGRLLAAAPFTATRLGRLAPARRLWSHEYGPLGVPLLDAERLDEAAAALLVALVPADSGRALIVPDLPLEGPVAAALARAARASRRSTAVLSRHARAVAVRDGSAARDPAAGLSHHRRHEYARLMRRLADKGPVAIATAVELSEVEAAFAEFVALEAAGWKGKAGTALGSDPARLAFAREAVAARAATGAVRIHSVRLNGRAVASLVTFVSGGTAFTWKIAYDESEAKSSPGAQVLLAALSELLEEPAIGRIDSCAAPNHALADPLFPERMAIGTFVISPVGEGALYRAGLAAARLEAGLMVQARRVRDRMRR